MMFVKEKTETCGKVQRRNENCPLFQHPSQITVTILVDFLPVFSRHSCVGFLHLYGRAVRLILDLALVP